MGASRVNSAADPAAAKILGGLSVVKAITGLHGGSAQVRSAVGQGTTFSIYLPGRP